MIGIHKAVGAHMMLSRKPDSGYGATRLDVFPAWFLSGFGLIFTCDVPISPFWKRNVFSVSKYVVSM